MSACRARASRRSSRDTLAAPPATAPQPSLLLLPFHLASAEKPLRIVPYQGLPRPGAVAGDQVPTDGVLAYILGFTFLHYMPELTGVPLGPGLMHRWGELVRPLLFRRADSARAAVISRGPATEGNWPSSKQTL